MGEGGRIKTNYKVTGLDGIPSEVLKYRGEVSVNFLHKHKISKRGNSVT